MIVTNLLPSLSGGLCQNSIVEAGKLIGLGKNASYDAAKAGKIPVMEFGKQKIVPRLEWLKKIGGTDAA